MGTINQERFVLNYMARYGSIDAKRSIKHGVYRLSARIFNLRKEGYEIITTYYEVDSRLGDKGKALVAFYSLKTLGKARK